MVQTLLYFGTYCISPSAPRDRNTVRTLQYSETQDNNPLELCSIMFQTGQCSLYPKKNSTVQHKSETVEFKVTQ